MGQRRSGGIDLHQIDRTRGKREAAIDGCRRARGAGARCKGAAVANHESSNRAAPGNRTAGNGDRAADRAGVVDDPRGIGERLRSAFAALLSVPLLVKSPDTVAPTLLLKVPAIHHGSGPGQIVGDGSGVGSDVAGPCGVIGDAAGIGCDIPGKAPLLPMLPALLRSSATLPPTETVIVAPRLLVIPPTVAINWPPLQR